VNRHTNGTAHRPVQNPPNNGITLEQLIQRRDALIAAARAIPVNVMDEDADPVLRRKRHELLTEAGKLFLVIQRLERKAHV
jgi:hypothetical protein